MRVPLRVKANALGARSSGGKDIALALLLTVCAMPLRDRARAASDKTISDTSAAAKELEAKIQILSETKPATAESLQPVIITEDEANSYLKSHSPELFPRGVTNPEVHIAPDHVSAAAEVNFSQLNQEAAKTDDWQAKALAWLFSNKQRVAAKGKLESGNGEGKLAITSVTVGTMELPQWLVDWVVQAYVQPRTKTDLKKPFALPDHVTRIELAPGRATFYRSLDKKKSL